MIDDDELVKYVILIAGVDVNIRNMHNGISLHIALAGGAKSCVELLLSIGEDLELNFIIQDFILLSRYMLVVAVIKFLQFLLKVQIIRIGKNYIHDLKWETR
ncbi:hypothetical protein JHK82_016439 [Glycine max]|nr:hypothetical protein JHK85_016853 [Glycine max]KAG5149558.1 hypothetical protein JHK82_016439 [Glycine max]